MIKREKVKQFRPKTVFRKQAKQLVKEKKPREKGFRRGRFKRDAPKQQKKDKKRKSQSSKKRKKSVQKRRRSLNSQKSQKTSESIKGKVQDKKRRIDTLIYENLKKHYEKQKKEERKLEEKVLRTRNNQQLKSEVIKKQVEIRKKRLQFKRKRNFEKKEKWGTHKNVTNQKGEARPNQKRKRSISQKDRRANIGTDFLNNLSDRFIKGIITKQKVHTPKKNTPKFIKKVQKDPSLRKFIQRKKKYHFQQKRKSKKVKIEQNSLIDKNLRALSQKRRNLNKSVKVKVKKKRFSSVKPKRNIRKTKKITQQKEILLEKFLQDGHLSDSFEDEDQKFLFHTFKKEIQKNNFRQKRFRKKDKIQACIVIQRWFRGHRIRKNLHKEFQLLTQELNQQSFMSSLEKEERLMKDLMQEYKGQVNLLGSKRENMRELIDKQKSNNKGEYGYGQIQDLVETDQFEEKLQSIILQHKRKISEENEKCISSSIPSSYTEEKSHNLPDSLALLKDSHPANETLNKNLEKLKHLQLGNLSEIISTLQKIQKDPKQNSKLIKDLTQKTENQKKKFDELFRVEKLLQEEGILSNYEESSPLFSETVSEKSEKLEECILKPPVIKVHKIPKKPVGLSLDIEFIERTFTSQNQDEILKIGKEKTQEILPKKGTLKQNMEKEDQQFEEIIQCRQESLDLRHETQVQILKGQFQKGKLTPRTYKTKQISLQKWLSQEKTLLKDQTTKIKSGWICKQETLKRTQQDFQFLQNHLAKADFIKEEHMEKLQKLRQKLQMQCKSVGALKMLKMPIFPKSVRKKEMQNVEVQVSQSKISEQEDEQILFTNSDILLTEGQSEQSKQLNQLSPSDVYSPKEKIFFGSQDIKRTNFNKQVSAQSDILSEKEYFEQFEILSQDMTSHKKPQNLDDILNDDELFINDKEHDFNPQNEEKKVNENVIDGITESILGQMLDELPVFRAKTIPKVQIQENPVQIKRDSIGQQSDQKEEKDEEEGIKTDMTTIEEYLTRLRELIANQNLSQDFFKKINSSLGPPPIERLDQITSLEVGSQKQRQRPILDPQLYVRLVENLQELGIQRPKIVVEAEHIHNKLIFDCFSDMFDKFRPYGTLGKPYPWKIQVKKQEGEHTKDSLAGLLKRAENDVLKLASNQCGILIENSNIAEALPEVNKYTFLNNSKQNIKEDSEQKQTIQELRDEKMNAMLQQVIFENDQEWLYYDEEEVEVGIQISKMVFESLINEMAVDLQILDQQ